MLLPPTVIGYIASFLQSDDRVQMDALLNMYKAFECFDVNGDPYRECAQTYIAYLALAYISHKGDNAFNLTNREIMYVYDCIYCDVQTIMYGDLPSKEAERFVDNEFLDCSELTEDMYIPQHELEYDRVDDVMNIKTYKYIRLLEEALRLKSTQLLAYMKKSACITPSMLFYVYIKHNHPLYAPKWFSLAADDLLLELCHEAGVLQSVLQLAIGNKRSDDEYAPPNDVRHNLETVIKIVPRYFDATDLFDIDDETSRVTVYNAWNAGAGVNIKDLTGSKEIGKYLLCVCTY